MFKHVAWLTAVLACGLVATSAPALPETMLPGKLVVHNEAKVFSDPGIEAAKQTMAATDFDHGLTLTVDTVKDVPEGRRAELKQKGEKAFFRDWARERARDEKAGGVYVLVCRSPAHVYVEAGDKTVARGFTAADERKLHDILIQAFADSRDKPEPEALSIRDAGLKAAVEFVVNDLKGTTAPEAGGSDQVGGKSGGSGGGSNLMGWVCLGLAGLLGAWLVIGLIRAFSGGGTGGRGGFFPMLLGGLFGAVAGMWLYNSFFSGGGMFGGSDAYAGDGGDGGGDYGGGGEDFGGDDGAGGGFDGGGDF
jgi:uncharacterized protein